MEWRVRIHRRALRFLEELQGVLPYRRLDIRRLRGEWECFLRLRVGDIRVIFRLDFDTKTVYIYHIRRRRSAYK